MKSLIAKTNYYSIEVDKGNNRAYLGIFGYCKSTDAVPNLLNDVEKAASQLGNGFTLLTDVSQMKTHPQDVSALHIESQKIWVKNGLAKTAEVLPNSAVDRMALGHRSRTSGMTAKGFEDIQKAEAWLDE